MKKNEYRKRTLSLIMVFCLVLSLLPGLGLTARAANADDSVYPLYAITPDTEDSDKICVHTQTVSVGEFTTNTYLSLEAAINAITSDVGSNSATLVFGSTFDTESGTVSGTLSTMEGFSLGSRGTYTLKGNLTADGIVNTDAYLIDLDGAALIVDGACIECKDRSTAIMNDGSGSVTVKSGAIKAAATDTESGHALLTNGTGDIIISGGQVSSEQKSAIQNEGSGTISISNDASVWSGAVWAVVSYGPADIRGGTITGGDGFPALVCYGGNISGGTITCNNENRDFDTETGKIPGAVLLIGATSDAALTVNGGTIQNTAETGYGIFACNSPETDVNYGTAVYLSGTPAISGGTADVWASSGIHADDRAAADAISYEGPELTLYYGGEITSEQTVAVHDVTDGNKNAFRLTNDQYILNESGSNLVIGRAPAPVTSSVYSTYPIYAVTLNPDGSTFDVQKQTESGTYFDALQTGVTLNTAISAITSAISSAVSKPATLVFGESLSAKTGMVSGTLDTGSKTINLGGEGSYTVMGSLTGSGSKLITLSGASMTVSGAALTCTGTYGITVDNTGTGSITVISGTLQSDNSYAIRINGGAINIEGGKVSSDSNVGAVYDKGAGTVTISGGEVSCTGTCGIGIASNKGTVAVTGGTITGNTAVTTVTAEISGGTLTGKNDSPALVCVGAGSTISGGTLTSSNTTTTFTLADGYYPGTVLVTDIGNTADNNAGLIISGGTITNTASSGYAVCCCDYTADSVDTGTTASLYLSGTPTISGAADLGTNVLIYADDGAAAEPAAYTGDALTLYYSGPITLGTTVVVSHVTKDVNDGLCSLTNDSYGLIKLDTNLIIGTAQAAPTGLVGVAPTSSKGIDGQITGTAAGMEYKLVSAADSTYTSCTDSRTTVGAAGDYLVRYAAAGTHAVSAAITVTIPAYGTYRVSGTVENSGNVAVSCAAVKVMRGKTQFGGTATTAADGTFLIYNVPNGEYNLVVTHGSHTITEFITVSDADYTAGTITLPDDSRNSILNITGDDTPSVVVNGLDREAEAQTDTSCTVTMTVSKKAVTDSEIQTEASNIISVAAGQTLEYLKISVTKTTDSGTATMTSLSTVQEIAVPYDFNGKNDITVYRYHGVSAAALTALSARPALNSAADGTFYADSANGKIYIYTKEFSTYAIGYSTSSGTSNSSGGSSHSGTVFATSGLPYYLNNSGNKVFIGFACDKNGTMKYIAPKSKTVLFEQNPKSFTDISGHWAKSAIDFVTQREIFMGTGSDYFSPDTGMTRAMFATVIGRLYERSYGAMENSGTHVFTDCNYNIWYGSYIDWCSKNSIIEGVGGSRFEPDRKITREEMAAILYRFASFLKASQAAGKATPSYPDASEINVWAQDAALYCQQTGIITGRDNGNFAPKKTATRSEVATILERFIEMIV